MFDMFTSRNVKKIFKYSLSRPTKLSDLESVQGRIQRGAHPARAPPKIGKKYDFLA